MSVAPERIESFAKRSVGWRKGKNVLFVATCIVTASLSMLILAVLLTAIFVQGLPRLNWQFVTNPPSPDANEAGIWPALWGSIWICAVCAVFTLPIGVGTAIFLEEFKPTHRALRMLHGFVQLNITNLAGVPSVVYGIIGVTAFVGMFGGFYGLFGTVNDPRFEIGAKYYDQFLTEGDRVLLVPVAHQNVPMTEVKPGMDAFTTRGRKVEVNVIGPNDPLPDVDNVRKLTLRSDAEGGRISRMSWYYFRLPFGRGVLAGGLTLMLVVLPIVIISSQESLRAVPESLREAAQGLGATRWQVVRRVTLPSAIPGIMTGSILAMSRAIGEAAPILIIAGIVYISSAPKHLMDDFSVMPLQIYNWAQLPQKEFHELAASGIIVLLIVLLSFNAIAVFIRQKFQKPLS